MIIYITHVSAYKGVDSKLQLYSYMCFTIKIKCEIIKWSHIVRKHIHISDITHGILPT